MNSKPLSLPLLGLLALLPAGSASAYLGGFEEWDGYHSPVSTSGGYINNGGIGLITGLGIAGDANFFLNNNPGNGYITWVPQGALPHTTGDATHGPDVTRYNAGQFGTNAGGPGGIGVDIRDDTGLWSAVSGGRLDEDANAPVYNGTLASGRDYVIAYRYTNARTGIQVLDVFADEVDMTYDYRLDSRDLGGQTVSSTNNNQVTMSFWFCPPDTDDTYTANTLGLGVWDANGQRLIEVGYTGTNQLQYRVGNSSLWQTSAVTVGSFGWSQYSLVVDTAADTASIEARAWDDNTSSLGSVQTILSTSTLGLDGQAFEKLRWSAEGGVLDENTGDAAYKNYFDDFQFTAAVVPEPGSALMVALVGLTLVSRRRRDRKPTHPNTSKLNS
jgi:hypothetical protein